MKYHVWSGKFKKCVCLKMFLAIFGVSQKRVQSIAKLKQSGHPISERRGGDRKSKGNSDKREKVKEFLRGLKGKESHYGRSKSRRIYLDSKYNIAVLHRLYNQKIEAAYKVPYKFFSRIFNNNFNIGFGSPATDVCGFCVRHSSQISLCRDNLEKDKLKLNLKVHKTRAQQFYKLMKETPENSISYCFDLQQVQVLPKTPVGDAFYAQQLSFYAFCVTDISCKSPFFYTWLEHEAARGCVEVGSALFSFLSNVEFPENVNELRLFSDGCGGQNKNSHIVHMLMVWLHTKSPANIKSITMFFPVRGHSYMPADRVFGRVEKLIRSHCVIKSPEGYYKLYRQVGTVKILGRDWILLDIKHALNVLKKIVGISEAKRIIIRKSANKRNVVVKTEMFYTNDSQTQFFTLLKKGKNLNNISFPVLALRHKIKEKKVQSLKKLLQEMASTQWAEDPELEWLVTVFEQNEHNENNFHQDAPEDPNNFHETYSEDDNDEVCVCNEEDGGVKV